MLAPDDGMAPVKLVVAIAEHETISPAVRVDVYTSSLYLQSVRFVDISEDLGHHLT